MKLTPEQLSWVDQNIQWLKAEFQESSVINTKRNDEDLLDYKFEEFAVSKYKERYIFDEDGKEIGTY